MIEMVPSADVHPQVAPVPLVDLAWQVRAVEKVFQVSVREILAGTSFVLGSHVRTFEDEFAAYSGVGHCVGVANGTDAIELALRAVGVCAGDEVILPANTFVASAGAVLRMGAVPVLVDCDPVTYLVDVNQVEAAITSRTRALLPVHLYGRLTPMARLRAVADQHGLSLVEDAAQAQGARNGGGGVSAVGDAAATSFYPGKNLGAFGDAGAVLTRSAEVADRVRLLRNHGSASKYDHAIAGCNSRMDTLQAAVLSAKLRHLEGWNALRRAAARSYTERLADEERVGLPAPAEGDEHVWHLYVVRVPDRDRVLKQLNAVGIGAGIHYPTPLHRTGALAHRGYQAGEFPHAEQAAGEILSLPLFPGIREDQQEAVVDALVTALSGRN